MSSFFFPLLITFLSLLLSIPRPPAAAAGGGNSPPLYPNYALPTESGYLPINSKSSLFFTFYEAGKPRTPLSTTPLLVWIQGGPGCSTMVGSLYELGPWLVSDDLRLRRNPFTWNRRFALLFIDSPLGTGFSPAPSASSIPRRQSVATAHFFTALQSFLSAHPLSFRSRPPALPRRRG